MNIYEYLSNCGYIAQALPLLLGLASIIGMRLRQSPAAQAYMRGERLLQVGRFREAIPHFDRAIAQDPGFMPAYHQRGAAYYGMGRYEKAIEDGTKAISLAPDLSILYADRARAFTALGQYQRAIDDCNKALYLDPTEWYAYTNRAEAYERCGRYDQTIKDRERARRVQCRPVRELRADVWQLT